MSNEPAIILCYRRKSIVRERADELSLRKQTEAVNALVRAAGYVPEWYEDGDVSGRHEAGRSAWQRLKSDITRDDVAGMAAYSLSRIYRDVKGFLRFLDQLEAQDKTLLLVKENIDTSSAVGRAVTTILMTMYQLESDLASERHTETIEYLRMAEGRHWGFTPMGCDRDEETKQLVPAKTGYWYNAATNNAALDEPEGPGWAFRTWHASLLRAFQICNQRDISYATIAQALNASGYLLRAQDGSIREWTREAVYTILSNYELYAGNLPLGRATEDRDVVAGGHDPIIPPDLAQSVAVKLARRSRSTRAASNPNRAIYIISGVAYCATCGQHLDGMTKRGKRHYKHRYAKGDCPEVWVQAKKVEGETVDLLIRVLRGDFLSLVREEMATLIGALGGVEVEAIQTQIQKERERLDRLIDIYIDGEIEKAAYIERRRNIESDITLLEDKIPSQPPDLEALLERLGILITEIGEAEPARQREIVEAIFERVEIGDRRVQDITPRPWCGHFFAILAER